MPWTGIRSLVANPVAAPGMLGATFGLRRVVAIPGTRVPALLRSVRPLVRRRRPGWVLCVREVSGCAR